MDAKHSSLPSVREITNSKVLEEGARSPVRRLFLDGVCLQESSAMQVVRDKDQEDRAYEVVSSQYSLVELHQDKVIKRRLQNTPVSMFVNEVRAIQFVKEHTTIPVPTILHWNENHIVMSRIEGSPMCEHSIQGFEEDIVSQLQGYCSQLWNITSSMIGSFVGPTFEFASLVTEKNIDYPKGPYSSVDNYLRSYRVKEGLDPSFMGVYSAEEYNAIVSTHCNFRLRHGDFEPRNILVKDGVVTGVVDWSMAGFYPETTFWDDGNPFIDRSCDDGLILPLMRMFDVEHLEQLRRVISYFTITTMFEASRSDGDAEST